MMIDTNKQLSVDVIMITYGHEDFIKEAIDGVLKQKTTFPIRLIISNDNSPDNSHQIIKSYIENTLPENITIEYINHPKNIGMMPNFIYSLGLTTAKYIALCEGDDYWTDNLKLQKQIDFLDNNIDYSICFHDVFELKKNKLKNTFFQYGSFEKTFTLTDLSLGNLMHTPSVVFRNNFQKINLPEWFKFSPAGDYVLHMINASFGKIKYLPEKMAVYRINETGVWSSNTYINNLQKINEVLFYLKTYFVNNTEIITNLQKQIDQNIEKYNQEVFKSYILKMNISSFITYSIKTIYSKLFF